MDDIKAKKVDRPVCIRSVRMSDYSYRNADIGSTFDARRAGR